MKLVLFLLSLFFINSIFAQNEEKITFDPERAYTQNFVDSLIGNTNIRIELDDFGKMLNSNKALIGWAHFYSLKSSRAVRNGFNDSVIYYANRTFKAYEDADIKRSIDVRGLILAHINKARVLSIQSDYSNSIINYQSALELEKMHDYKWISFARAGLARLHYEIGNDSLALKYFLDASRDTAYMRIPRSSVTTNIRIASLYQELDKTQKAQRYYNYALDASNNTSYKDDIAGINGSLGGINWMSGKTDSALYYYKKAIVANKKYGIPKYRGARENSIFHKSYVNVYEGNLSYGIDSLKMLINTFNNWEEVNKDDMAFVDKITQLLGIAYEKQGNPKAYNRLFTNYVEFSKKYEKHKEKQDLERLEKQYQTKEKDASIAQLEENKVQQEKIIEQQKTIAFSLAGLLFLLSGLGYLFWKQRKFKNQYEKENLEQRLLRSQMNPHFVSNALNTVCALVDKKSDHTIPYVNKLAGLFRLTLTNSREEFIGLDEEISALKTYLELQSNLSDDFDFSITVDNDVEINEFIVPPMLMQPFVENAIIHGLSGAKNRGNVEIKISKDKSEKLLACYISDNGIGYGNKSIELKKHKSVSGDIVRERLAILKKKFKVNTRFNIIPNDKNGTRVELYVPYLID